MVDAERFIKSSGMEPQDLTIKNCRNVTKMFAQIFIHTSALVFASLKPKGPTGLSPADSESCYGNMQI